MTTAKKNVLTMKNGPPFWKTSLSQLIGPRFYAFNLYRSQSSPVKQTRDLVTEIVVSVIRCSRSDPAVDRVELLATEELTARDLRHQPDGRIDRALLDAEHHLEVARARIARHDELGPRHQHAVTVDERGKAMARAQIDLALLRVLAVVTAGERALLGEHDVLDPAELLVTDGVHTRRARAHLALAVARIGREVEVDLAGRREQQREQQGPLTHGARPITVHKQFSVQHFAGGRGAGGAATRSSKLFTGAPERNLAGNVPRTNGIHTASGDALAGSPLHGSTRAKLTFGGTGKSRIFVRGCAFCMKSSQMGTLVPPPVILSPIGSESSRPTHAEHSRSVVKPLNHASL